MANEDTAKKFADIANKHYLNALLACWAENAEIYDPGFPQPIKGKAAIRQNLDGWLKAFPDFTFKVIEPVLSKGENVAFQVTIGGTHRGDLAGPQGTVAPTNKKFQFTGMDMWTVTAQGLIAEERRYYDTADMMRQLGITH